MRTQPDWRTLQRCGVTLVWTGVASGSSEPQARVNCCPFSSKAAHVITRSARVSQKRILHIRCSRQGKASTAQRSGVAQPATSVPVIPPAHAHCRCNSPTRSCNDERCIVGAKILPQLFGLTNLSQSCNQFGGCACGKRWAQTHGETSEIRDVMLQGIALRKILRNVLRERTGNATPRMPVFFFLPITWS